eukprot:222445-Pleurochrysis_carterae.AAC.1
MLHELLVLRGQRPGFHRGWPDMVEHQVVAGLRLPARVVDLHRRLRFSTAYVALVLHCSPCGRTSRRNLVRRDDRQRGLAAIGATASSYHASTRALLPPHQPPECHPDQGCPGPG